MNAVPTTICTLLLLLTIPSRTVAAADAAHVRGGGEQGRQKGKGQPGAIP
jgi:hypothetical protein